MDALTIGYISALAGDHDYTNGYETPYATLYTISSAPIIHPSYVDPTTGYDIAIFKTDSDIIYSRGVAPACIPWNYASTSFTGYKVDITGWGSTFFAGPPSTVLNKVTLDVVSNTQCSSKLQKTMLTSQLCTYTQGKDTCQYDSGGGLYLRYSRMWLIGIVSYGNPCYGTSPSANTQITSYLSWIQQNTPGAIYCNKNIA